MFHRKNIIYIPIFYFREYINFLVNKHHLISALTHNYILIKLNNNNKLIITYNDHLYSGCCESDYIVVLKAF